MLRVVFVGLLCASLIGCGTHNNRHMEEWGTLSISGMFPSSNGQRFLFDPKYTDREILLAERIEGSDLIGESQAIRAGVSGQLSIDGTEVTPDTGIRERTEAEKQVGSLRDFQNPRTDPTVTSQRRRIRLAAGDKWELGLHQTFAEPAGLPDGARAVYLVFTVHARPGWRTQEDFAGIVNARAHYTFNRQAIRLPGNVNPQHDPAPRFAAVYPSFDSQELDLRSSFRQLISFAGQAAAAGNGAAATAFLEAARRVEEDAQTNTGLAQVTSYSHGGTHFGFEFRPAFRALAQPGSRSSKPGYRLESTTIPAVAVAVIQMSELNELIQEVVFPRVYRQGGVTSALTKDDNNIDIKLLKAEINNALDAIKFEQLQATPDSQLTKDLRIALISTDRTPEQNRLVQTYRTTMELAGPRFGIGVAVSRTWRRIDRPWFHDIPGLEQVGEWGHAIKKRPEVVVQPGIAGLSSRHPYDQAQIYLDRSTAEMKSYTFSVPFNPFSQPLRVAGVIPTSGKSKGKTGQYIITGDGFDERTEVVDNTGSPVVVNTRTKKALVITYTTPASHTDGSARHFVVKRGTDLQLTPPITFGKNPAAATVTIKGKINGEAIEFVVPKEIDGDKVTVDQLEKLIKALQSTVPPASRNDVHIHVHDEDKK